MDRGVNKSFDQQPSIGHQFNAEVVGKELEKGDKILDIGCWTGQLLGALGMSEDRYFGLDPSAGAIAEAKRLYPKAHFKAGSALALPFEDSFFDCVVLLDVIEHLNKGGEEQCLKEVKRVVKKGGKFILSTPSDNLISIISDPAFFLMGHRHYSKERLKELMISAGFKVEDVFRTGDKFYVGYYLLQMFIKHILRMDLGKNKELFGLENLARKGLFRKKGFLSWYFITKSI